MDKEKTTSFSFPPLGPFLVSGGRRDDSRPTGESGQRNGPLVLVEKDGSGNTHNTPLNRLGPGFQVFTKLVHP